MVYENHYEKEEVVKIDYNDIIKDLDFGIDGIVKVKVPFVKQEIMDFILKEMVAYENFYVEVSEIENHYAMTNQIDF